MAAPSRKSVSAMEATVTSKGQITLPSELRKRLGLHKGSRVRFTMPSGEEVRLEPVRYSLDDIWRMADEIPRAGGVMSFDEMDAAKGRRRE